MESPFILKIFFLSDEAILSLKLNFWQGIDLERN